MPIANLEQYKASLQSQRYIVPINNIGLTTTPGRFADLWTANAPVGTVPTSAVALDRTVLGAREFHNPASGQTSIVGSRFSALNPGNYIIIDRLSHQGGLSGTSTSAQTTNLPTAALTRYTNGTGVMMGISIYTQIGTSSTTVSVSYTNQAGDSGRISPSIVIGNTGFREAGRLLPLPLQSGDTGVRSIESVTLAATTGTAGAFGVVLFKPLYVICVDQSSGVVSASGFITGGSAGGIPTVENNACLSLFCISQGGSVVSSGALLLEEN